MIRLILPVLFLLFPLFLDAQQPEKTFLPGIDSVYLSAPRLNMPEPFSFSNPFSSTLSLPLSLKQEALPFDFSKYLRSNWTVTYSSFLHDSYFPEFVTSPAVWLPFGATATLFNEATYRLNNRVKVGGNSFGMNSFLSPPLPRSGTNQWEIRGASVFMEYKVSKNVRVGAGISVSETPHPK